MSWLDPVFEPGLVSVIIPTFNRAALIGAALDSLEAQTWECLEIIVVDDGSTDTTLEVVRSRGPLKGSRRLRVISQANAGVSVARNTGTRASTGEFIVYLDSDDQLHPEAITRYVEALRTQGADYCYSPIDSVDESGRLTQDSRRFYPKMRATDHLFGCFWLVHGACYRRGVVAAAGPWNPVLRNNEDHEWLWRIKTVSGRGYHLDVVQGTYRQHSRDQLHHQLDRVRFHESRLNSIDVFAVWLHETGRLDRGMRLHLARECRFLATRLAILGQTEAKNRALERIDRFCAGFWHPLRLCLWLKHVDAPRAFEVVAEARYKWFRWTKGGRGRHAASPAAARPELLFLTPVFPALEGKGPARRAHAVITALERHYRVTMLVVSSRFHADSPSVGLDYLGGRWGHIPFDPGAGGRLPRSLARRFPGLYARVWRRPTEWVDFTAARRREARMAVEGQRFDVVHAFRLAMAPYALELAEAQPGSVRCQLDLDDIESTTNERLAALARLNGDEVNAANLEGNARAYARAERALFPRFDRLFVCSEHDRERLGASHADVQVLPNVVSAPGVPSPTGEERRPDGFRFLFVGQLNYPPNEDAVIWFAREVLPPLRKHRACSLVVGGRKPSRALQGLFEATPGVRAIGEFATAADGFSAGDALVVPLRAGGGTRIKILEAFAHGRPVISTSLGIEGIDATPERDFLLAENAEEFVRQAMRLIDNPTLRASLAKNARYLVELRYSPRVLVEVLRPGS